MSNAEKKAAIVAEFGKDKRDTGKSEVQIALISEEIKGLTEHMKEHPKDFRTQRSLGILVSRRRKLLKYLNRTAPDRYRELLPKLSLRK